MTVKKIVDGVMMDLTAEELSQRETDGFNALAAKTAREEADAQKETDKVNAKAKLIAGEALTADEANTIVL